MFHVALTKQLKRDNADHGDATINNVATVQMFYLLMIKVNHYKQITLTRPRVRFYMHYIFATKL